MSKVERYLPDNIYKGLSSASNPSATNPFLTEEMVGEAWDISRQSEETADIHTYGLLYNPFAAYSVHNIAPIDFQLPTRAQIETLLAHLGGYSVAGGKLKSTDSTYWDAPNTGALDSVGFNARGAGRIFNKLFYSRKRTSNFWFAEDDIFGSLVLQYNVNEIGFGNWSTSARGMGLSVRCVRVASEIELTYSDGTPCENAVDYEGNVYKTVKIGTQVWMAENLYSTKYQDGTDIPHVTDLDIWNTLGTDAFITYNNISLDNLTLIKPAKNGFIDPEYIYQDVDVIADDKFSSTNLNDYTKSGNYALDGVYTNAPFNSPNLSGILKISLRKVNGSTQIVQSYIHTNITDNNEVGKIWTRVRGTTWTSWKMQLTEDELSTGINLGRTYFISDTEDSDTWKAGKINFKTIGGFLAVFDANDEILHTHFFEGNITNNSDTITNIADTSLFNIGDLVYHTNIQYNSRVVAKSANTLQLSRTATGSTTGATIELKNIINVLVSGSQTTTLHINRVNLSYHGDAFITHNSNTEYLIEHTKEDLKQPICYFDSNFVITSIGTKGLMLSTVASGDQRSGLTGYLDYKFKFKRYIGKQDAIHFALANTTPNGYWYYNNILVEYEDIDVVGHWFYGYYGTESKHKYIGNRVKATKHVIYDQYYGGDYDIKSGLETNDPSTYYAFLVQTYQGTGHCNLNIRTKGKLAYMGGGVINIRAESADTPSASFSTNANYYKELIINGTLESPSLIIAGQVQLNANFSYVYCRNGYGTTKIKGTHDGVFVDSACLYPLILDIGTNYVNSYVSVTANREVITRGHLLNTGYNTVLTITAGTVRNQGLIVDGYYGIQVSGTGKFINESCGKIIYGVKGINQTGGSVVQNGKMERRSYGYAERCAIEKSGGDLTIGQTSTMVVSNGLNPILCVNNDSASKDVKFKIGCSSNADMAIAHPLGYAPNPVLTGYSMQIDTNITD